MLKLFTTACMWVTGGVILLTFSVLIACLIMILTDAVVTGFQGHSNIPFAYFLIPTITVLVGLCIRIQGLDE